MKPNDIEALRQHIDELVNKLTVGTRELDALKSSLQSAMEENDDLDQDNFALRLQISFLQSVAGGVKQDTSDSEDEVQCAMQEALAARDELARVKRDAAVAHAELVREATEYKERATSALKKADRLRILLGTITEAKEMRREYEALIRIAAIVAAVLLSGYFWFGVLFVLCAP